MTDRQQIRAMQKVNPKSLKEDQMVKIPKKNRGLITVQPHDIKNKDLRALAWQKIQKQKAKIQKSEKLKRKREQEELGEDAPPKKPRRSIDAMRVADDTIVTAEDTEVFEDEKTDEFAEYFDGKTPKILLTTCAGRIDVDTLQLINELLDVFQNSEYYSRRNYNLKEIVDYAVKRDYTDILVVNEDRKTPNGITFVHLPEGPTFLFKLTSLQLRKDIEGSGRPTSHKPELILNNFNTRLGHSVGRMFASLFPHAPNFKGRRVITLHNQRDYIFFRHHRYIIEDIDPDNTDAKGTENKKVRIQECGPRFCLKLRSVQKGTFDSKFGEYEFLYKADMGVNRKKFYL